MEGARVVSAGVERVDRGELVGSLDGGGGRREGSVGVTSECDDAIEGSDVEGSGGDDEGSQEGEDVGREEVEVTVTS